MTWIIQDNYGVNNFRQFEEQIRRIAAKFAAGEIVAGLTRLKGAMRAADEDRKPLAQCRSAGLNEMRRNFWGSDRSYHVARSAFVRKRPLEAGPMIDAAADLAATEAGRTRSVRDVSHATSGWSSTIGDVGQPT